jgi:hypothetical protein
MVEARSDVLDQQGTGRPVRSGTPAGPSRDLGATFITHQARWVHNGARPLIAAYDRLNGALAARGALGARLASSHIVFFVLVVAASLLLAPRYLALAGFLVSQAIGRGEAAAPDLSGLPHTPSIIAAVLAAFLATYFLPARRRLILGLAGSLPVLWLQFAIRLPGLAVYAGFIALTYGVVKLPISRYRVFGLLYLLACGLVLLARGWPALSRGGLMHVAVMHTFLVPMLWYSAHAEVVGRRRLKPGRHALFLYLRLLGSPVLTYRDVFGKVRGGLARVRYDGIKAVYTALLAVLAVWGIQRGLGGVAADRLTGWPLLGYSYLVYVAKYCSFVIVINTFIGALRLFGVPVRDNFHYWLLARTPNEHWRRWNILLREWIVSFVFFPVMRARRWLFVAVMGALLTSGLLHVVPRELLGRTPDWSRVSIIMFYWAMNGLAIYLVIKVPLVAPRLVERLRLRTSPAWNVTGVVLTSAFYGVFVTVRSSCANWREVGDYFSRLLGV